jgi:ribonucleoside-diphosphate reductase alpha chain
MSNSYTDLSPKSESLLNEEENTFVITRTGRRQLLDTNRITNRLKSLIDKAPRIKHVNPFELMLVVCQGLKSGISTYEIDEYAANASASLSLTNPHYMKLAGRIAVDNHQKNTKRSFTDKMKMAYLRKDAKGVIVPLLSKEFFSYVEEHQDNIERMIHHERDFLVDFFGFRTFQKIYAIKLNGYVIERPQDMYMRTSIAINMNTSSLPVRADAIAQELERIKDTYDLLSCKDYTQASPTYFNAGSTHPQYSSCFLMGTSDSCAGIMQTATDSSEISKWGGGLGIHCNEWRGAGTLIRGTNGNSSGIVPFLKIYNSVVCAFNQGGKRKGKAAIYLMPHHPDIIKFLELIIPAGNEEDRARDLFYAVWLPDIFMERVKTNSKWSLFDPDRTVNLALYYDSDDDKAYTNKYLELENSKSYTQQIDARQIWDAIYDANEQKGHPYIMFSDNVNRQNNQKNLGTIKSSNLCSEICEYSDEHETAVCNLCSISLSNCVLDKYNDDELTLPEEDRRTLNHEFPINPFFDFRHLLRMTKVAARNLDIIIDKNFYPTIRTERSNLRHRPIGIGFQGLADAYFKMRYPFESDEASILNKQIMETMYYGALSQSTRVCRDKYLELKAKCKEDGKITLPLYEYGTYDDKTIDYTADTIPTTVWAHPSMTWNGGTPLYNGIFHWELNKNNNVKLSGMWDWDTLRSHIQQYGTRNSLVCALMPTASTSQLLGNNECFEPFTSNIYKRKTLAGEYIVINKYLINDLYRMKIWNPQIKEYMLSLEGSIQSIEGIPDELKSLYKTSWEIDQRILIDRAADRQPFLDQSQSLNLYIENLSKKIFTNLMFRAWKLQLKTGKYYMHTRPAVMPQKFTIDPAKQAEMLSIITSEKNKRTTFLEPLVEVCDLCSG